MLGIGFLVFGGMREYLKSSLLEEAFNMVGEDALADYDRPLFRRYHLFLLDPRARDHLTEDASDGMGGLLSDSGLFQEMNAKFTLSRTQSALDDNGSLVMYQIKRWETYRGAAKLPATLNQLLKSTEKNNNVKGTLEQCKEDGDEDSEELKEEETEKDRKIKASWKEWKSTLDQILNSGILYYAVDHVDKISDLSFPSTKDLPSRIKGYGSSVFDLDSISLTGLSSLKNLYGKKTREGGESTLLTSDVYLVPYLFECFTHYKNQDTKQKHCLQYEMEYLVGGRTKDRSNLKYVANQLFLLRFLVNYAYAVTDQAISEQAHIMALTLTGIMGFPEAEEAVAMLVIASLCYGESLLEVRALFQGDKVALVKSSENWNLTFTNAVSKLRNRSKIIKVKNGVGYEQYLTILLVLRSGSRKLMYRMMDLMQCNVALEETGFLMKNSLTGWKWKATLSWKPWLKRIPVFSLRWDQEFSRDIERTISYR